MIAIANHLWQSTVFALLAAVVAFALRNNSARIRYRVWLIASLKFLLPFSLLMAVGTHLHWPGSDALVRPVLRSTVHQVAQPFAAVSNFSPTPQITTQTHLPNIILIVWLCGTVAILASWFARWLRIRAIAHAASPVALNTSTPLLSSPSSLEPGVFGIVRPVLLLPEGILWHLTPSQLQAILTHELCHVHHRDNLAAAFHMLIEALFWFHPMIWWIGARLVTERERACDEEVVRLGNQPQVYAESILKTCQFFLASPLACVSGVTGSDLKRRITRIMTQRTAARLSMRQKALLAAAAALAIALPLTVGLTNASQTVATLPSFEVASVKLDKPTNPDVWNSHWNDRPGKLWASEISLKDVIQKAYGVKDYQLEGPEWLKSARYDMAAEWPPSTPDSQFPLMLQSLLADRFKLAVHHEAKQLPVYELRVAKSGSKLKADTSDGHNSLYGRRGHLHGERVSVDQLVGNLSHLTGRPVLDMTWIKGRVAFELSFTPDDSSSPDTNGPSIFTAVEEQLGLKLVSQKAQVDILVIDHLDKIPTEN